MSMLYEYVRETFSIYLEVPIGCSIVVIGCNNRGDSISPVSEAAQVLMLALVLILDLIDDVD